MRKLLAAVALLLAGCAAHAATYTHTRPPYSGGVTFTVCAFPPCAAYTTAMQLTGSFSTAAPLAANLVNIDIYAQLTSFSFNDGLVTYTSSDPLVRVVDFRVSTSAAGAVTSIYIFIMRWRNAGPHAVNDRVEHIESSYSSYNRRCTAIGVSPAGVPDTCLATNGDANSSYFFAPLPWATLLLAPAPASIPSLHAWGAALLALLMAAAGALSVRPARAGRWDPPP